MPLLLEAMGKVLIHYIGSPHYSTRAKLTDSIGHLEAMALLDILDSSLCLLLSTLHHLLAIDLLRLRPGHIMNGRTVRPIAGKSMFALSASGDPSEDAPTRQCPVEPSWLVCLNMQRDGSLLQLLSEATTKLEEVTCQDLRN